ncbi:unnamed protein product [Ceratitis capitata]|uniref:(Mediterranean fruit fly) hypothetical protein n=1 Tax=Ceratitis capitata TaxID=7213 RepID=A0A811U9V0_CERCA|nr:unnamed protein product [Ceratitis capitata]
MSSTGFTMDFYIETLEKALRRSIPDPAKTPEASTKEDLITGSLGLLLMKRKPLVEKILKDISTTPGGLTVFQAVKKALDEQSGDSMADIEELNIYTELVQILLSS